jgi:mevalonate kinase
MGERWLRHEQLVVDGIAEISELAEPGAQALLSGDYGKLAQGMNLNQEVIRRLGGSGDSVDQLVEDCRANGALSAKLAGAGLGGTVIALTEGPDELEEALRGRGYSRFIRPAIVDGVRFEA